MSAVRSTKTAEFKVLPIKLTLYLRNQYRVCAYMYKVDYYYQNNP